MQARRILVALKVCALTALVAAAVLWPRPGPAAASGGNSITSPDTDGNLGYYSSLALDGGGNPVVSYRGGGVLKVLHCNDPNCAGGDDSITSPDMAGAGDDGYTSLALDGSGNPVVSYRGGGVLKVLHCGDPSCTSGNSITSPDTDGNPGYYSSLALDGGGNPVVSYLDASNALLKVLHCNDPNCAGGDESITAPDTVGIPNIVAATSLALDGTGNPVVSYYGGFPNENLKVLHCDDPNCAGGGESIAVPDTGGPFGDVGLSSSLALDGGGNPVVSYLDLSNWDLKVLHCNDPNCVSADESITAPDTGDLVGIDTSLALDASGNPVVSYFNWSNSDLKVLHCNDPNCAGGDESITVPDTGSAGFYASLALDGGGNPVVSYRGGGDLKVLHCFNRLCTTSPDLDLDGCTDAAEQQPKANAGTGGGRDPKNYWDFYDVPDPNPPEGFPQRNGAINIDDIFWVIDRFGNVDDNGNAPINRNTDPLSKPPKTGYHPAYDRGQQIGANAWNLAPANGSITIDDIFDVAAQFGHDCS